MLPHRPFNKQPHRPQQGAVFMSTFNLGLLMMAVRPLPATLSQPEVATANPNSEAIALPASAKGEAFDKPLPPAPEPELPPEAPPADPEPPEAIEPPAVEPPIVEPPAPTTQFHRAPAYFDGQTVYQAELTRPAIALTFDDGPWPDTLAVLEILRQNDVRATFFIVGSHLQMYPEIAEQMAADGHILGNHSWNHRYYAVSSEEAAREIENTSASLNRQTGVYPRLFRPPGGNLTNGLADYAAGRNYTVVMWSIDPQDTAGRSAEALVAAVLSQAHPGAIVLLHDGGGPRSQTVRALPDIIAGLRSRGYELVTVPELLEMELQERKLPVAPAP